MSRIRGFVKQKIVDYSTQHEWLKEGRKDGWMHGNVTALKHDSSNRTWSVGQYCAIIQGKTELLGIFLYYRFCFQVSFFINQSIEHLWKENFVFDVMLQKMLLSSIKWHLVFLYFIVIPSWAVMLAHCNMHVIAYWCLVAIAMSIMHSF